MAAGFGGSRSSAAVRPGSGRAGRRMQVEDLLYRAPAWLLLLLPVVLVLLAFGLVLLLLPSGSAGGYLVFAFVLLAMLVSRMLRVWEWGVEVFHFLTFCISFAYGFWPAFFITMGMSALVLSLLLNVRAHYFTYGATSILVQSVGAMVTVLLAGLLSFLAPDAVRADPAYFGTFAVSISLLLDKALTHRFVGIDWGRLSVSLLLDVVINYNLFLLFGAGALSFFSAI